MNPSHDRALTDLLDRTASTVMRSMWPLAILRGSISPTLI